MASVTLTHPDAVCQRIAEAIDASGLAQDEVADAVGVHPSAVSHWVTGRAVPTLANLRRIASVVGVDVADLLRDEPLAQPEEPQQP